MATVQDILNKSKHKPVFKPVQHRAWDYLIEKQESKNKLDSRLDSNLDSEKLKNSTPLNNKENNTLKLDSRLGSNLDSLDSNLDSRLDSLDSRLGSNLGSLDSNLGSKLDSRLDSNLDSGLDSKKTKHYLSVLGGRQLEFFSYILKICMKNGELSTGTLNTNKISNDIKMSYGTVKDTINKLIKKGLIYRAKGKTSSQGFIMLNITKEIKDESIKLGLDSNLDIRLGSKLDSNLDSKATSSSSSYNIILTTTGDEEFLKKWDLDIEPLAKIGFTKTHLEQIYSQKKLTPEITQDSIYAFAFDLEVNNRNEKINGQPLNFFMGILRKGKPYAPPPNYESPSDRAMREYLESKEKLKKQREEIEEKACHLAFEGWFSKLSLEEKKKYNVPGVKFNPDSKVVESLAFSAFKENIWQNMKQEIIKMGES